MADTMSMDATGKTADGRKHAAQLEHCAKLAGHPSPRAEDSEQTVAHRGEPDTLTSCERLAGHHTPAVRDLRNSAGDGTNPRDNPRLQALASPGPTPASTDTSTAKTAGYRLNPLFSLWLMVGSMNVAASWAMAGARSWKTSKRR
jgi:hypothetical protein